MPNDFFANLQRQAEENPVFALGIAAGLITAISKLLSASAERKNSTSWARETKRRDKMSK